MYNSGKTTTPSSSALDVEKNCGKKRKRENVAGDNSQSDKLTAKWLNVKEEVESSDKMPTKVVRRVLAHLRTSNPVVLSKGQGENNPLNILPEEMWDTILNYISEPMDLMSCAGTCTLFKRIVDENKNKMLFGMTFPMISRYLDHQEILNCRLVCRKWDIVVCTTAEWGGLNKSLDTTSCSDLEVQKYMEYLAIRDRKDGLNKPLYSFSFPNSLANQNGNNNQAHLNFCLPAMRQHPKNPFIGGRVVVTSVNPVTLGGPRFIAKMKTFLTDFGRHLTSLNLKRDNLYVPDTYKNLCSLVSSVFKKCPQLRSFRMVDHSCLPEDDVDAIFQINDLPEHSAIRSITIGQAECEDIEYQLFRRYSNQLTVLHVTAWNYDTFGDMPWENLVVIEFMVAMRSEITDALRSLHAPQLKCLYISFIDNEASFQSILEAITSFPTLETLLLDFGPRTRSVPKQKEFLDLPTQIICRSSIATLVLNVAPFSCFDFLVCFPFVKNLSLGFSPGTNIMQNAKALQEMDLLLNARCSQSSSASPSNTVQVTGQSQRKMARLFGQLVHINQHWVRLLINDGKDEEGNVCMFRSNVWEILPFLHTLNIYHPSGSPIPKVFTRRDYLDGGFDKENK